MTITDLETGEHVVKLSKEGYIDHGERVRIKANETARLEATLQQWAYLTVNSSRVGAEVFLQGGLLGKTPLERAKVEPGYYQIMVRSSGYVAYLASQTLIAGRTTTLTAELVRAASLQVNSDPSGAAVLLDRQSQGMTPVLVRDLAPGSHKVKLTGAQTEDWSGEAMLVSGETGAVNAKLVLKKGSIRVTSNVEDADILLDGRDAGRTPATLTGIPYGSHTIRITKVNHKTLDKTIDLREPGPVTLNVRLEVAMATLAISGVPPGAEFWLDGNEATPPSGEKIDVAPGEHVLIAKAVGYENSRYMLQFAPGEAKTIDLTMRQKTVGKAMIRSFILPGLGQAYAGKKNRAILYPLLEAGALAGVLLSVNQYNGAVDEYGKSRDNYLTAVSGTDIARTHGDMQNKYDAISKAENQRTIMIAAAAGIWIWNVVDALIWPSQKAGATNIGAGPEPNLHLFYIQDQRMARVGLCWLF